MQRKGNKPNHSARNDTAAATADRIPDIEKNIIPRLRASFRGQVITPGDASYEEVRTIFYGGFNQRPGIIARPVDARGVSYIVSLARENGLELAIRSGGHSPAGHSLSTGGIVLDLRNLRSLKIDLEHRTAWAEAGLTAGEYTASVGAYNYATGFGDTGTVGIGGITLGGGIGFLVRKHGLTIDNLLAADVVTADGELLRADAESEPDLFWAIRGGGGNFGVATRFQYQLHKLEMILGGLLILPATPESIASFITLAEEAPEELSTIANVMTAPAMPFVPAEYHGKLVLMIMLVYAGSTGTGDIDAGERTIAPFRALATPIADLIRPMRYHQMFQPDPANFHPTAVGRTMFIKSIDRSVAETILETLRASDASLRVAQLRVLGGAMACIPTAETAFAHRNSRIMVNLAAFYNGPEERAKREAWVNDFAALLDQGDSGTFVNFLDEPGQQYIRKAYPGSTWDRLTTIKSRYDPTNLFRRNHNIPPM